MVFRKAEQAATDACEGNLLHGTLEEEIINTSETCYAIGAQSNKAGFFPYLGTTLAANRAYYFGEALSGFNLILTDTGMDTQIEGVTTISPDAAIYDLSGRRVKQPTKGIYIMNGKKIVK